MRATGKTTRCVLRSIVNISAGKSHVLFITQNPREAFNVASGVLDGNELYVSRRNNMQIECLATGNYIRFVKPCDGLCGIPHYIGYVADFNHEDLKRKALSNVARFMSGHTGPKLEND